MDRANRTPWRLSIVAVVATLGIGILVVLVKLGGSDGEAGPDNQRDRSASSQEITSEQGIVAATRKLPADAKEKEEAPELPAPTSTKSMRSLDELFDELGRTAAKGDHLTCRSITDEIIGHGATAAPHAVRGFKSEAILEYCVDVLRSVGLEEHASLLWDRMCDGDWPDAALSAAIEVACELDSPRFSDAFEGSYLACAGGPRREQMLDWLKTGTCQLSGDSLARLFVATASSDDDQVLRRLLGLLCAQGRGDTDLLYDLFECYVARPRLRTMLAQAIAVLHSREEAMETILALARDPRVDHSSYVSPLREGFAAITEACQDPAAIETLIAAVQEDGNERMEVALAVALGDTGNAPLVAEPLQRWYTASDDKPNFNSCVHSLARLDDSIHFYELVNERLSSPDWDSEELPIFTSALNGIIRRDPDHGGAAAYLMNDVVLQFVRRASPEEHRDTPYLVKNYTSAIKALLSSAESENRRNALSGLTTSIDSLLRTESLRDSDRELLRSALAAAKASK